jgi:hypothetical protein
MDMGTLLLERRAHCGNDGGASQNVMSLNVEAGLELVSWELRCVGDAADLALKAGHYKSRVLACDHATSDGDVIA